MRRKTLYAQVSSKTEEKNIHVIPRIDAQIYQVTGVLLNVRTIRGVRTIRVVLLIAGIFPSIVCCVQSRAPIINCF